MLTKAIRDKAKARVGTTVGKYEIDALLGVGGMGAVFAVTHVRNRSRAAMKVLHRELIENRDMVKRFVGEGYIANKIGHRAVVQILDDDVDDDGCPFLVMELLDGMTLDRYRRGLEGAISLSLAVDVADQLLDVLAAAHKAGVVHRDIKPDNVFMLRDGTVKLMDFGIARLLDGSNGTTTGAILGTPAFMAPEQANGQTRQVDARTEIWSVGATLFWLLTGEEVHVAVNPQDQLLQAATERARSLAEVDPSMPAELVHLVDSALAFEKDARWQSAEEMRGALTRAAAAAGIARSRTSLGAANSGGESGAPTTIIRGSDGEVTKA